MKGIVDFWGRNPVAGNLLMIACFVLGLLSFNMMEKEFFPPGRSENVQINAAWPGASPEDMESQVIVRVEEALADLNGVTWVRSRSGEGFGWVSLSLSTSVDPEDIANEARSRVESISGLPPGLEPIRVARQTGRNQSIILGLSGAVDERVLRDTAERLRDEIALLPGGVNTEVIGARRPEVSIELSETAMRAYGLTFDEVSNAIRATSVNGSGGTVRTPDGDFQIAARNLADSERDFEQIIIRQSPDGGIVRLGDVATVIDGFQDVNLYSRLNGQPGVLLFILTPDRFNIWETNKAVQDYIAEARTELPPGVNLNVVFNETRDFNALTGILFSNAAMGFFLIFVLLLLTLHPKVALWSTLGVITAFAGSFIILPYLDVSLNFMTVFGFLLVLGIMVDDAIIVGESIYERVEQGYTGVDSAILATQLVMKPLLASVFTTIIAFAPLAFLDGDFRQFTAPITVVIMSTLFFSLVETLIILPAHLAHVHVIHPGKGLMGRLMRAQQVCANSVLWFAHNIHGPLVRFAVAQRYVTVAVFLAVIVLSVGLFMSGRVKQSFFPEVEGDFLFASISLPQTTPFSRMEEIAAQLDAARAAMEQESSDIVWTDPDSGEASRGVIVSWSQFIDETQIQAFIGLTPPETRELRTSAVAERLEELLGDVPDAEQISFEFGGGGGGPAVVLAMLGENPDEVRAAVEELKTFLSSLEGVSSVRDSEEAAIEELRVSLRPGAEQLGVTLADVRRQVYQAYFGDEVQRLPRDGDEVRVYLRYPREDRRSLESLRDFRVRTADGREVPLAAVAEVSFGPGVTALDRRQRQPTITVEAEADQQARQQIMRTLNEEFFPQLAQRYPNVSHRPLGQAESEAEFRNQLTSMGVAALFAIYFLLAVTFRSYAQPAVIMSVIPFAFVGAVMGHYITGTSFALFSWLGLVAAIGVVVNDNVVLMDRVNRLRQEGASAYDAVTGASISRFRQIFLTSITEFVGLMPMLLEQATISQFLKPMAISLAFGVLLCLPASLYMSTSLYMIGRDINQGAGALWRRLKRLWGVQPRPTPAE